MTWRLRPETRVLLTPILARPVQLGAALRALEVLALADTPEPLVAVEVAPLCFDGDGDLARAAAGAVLAAVLAARGLDFVALDGYVRGLADDWIPAPRPRRWDALRPEDLGAVEALGAGATAVLGLASAHARGQVREAAVRRLAARTDALAIPFLLVRLNDWVPEVRAAARESLSARLRDAATREATARTLVRNLPLVERLTRWMRADHAPIAREIAVLLTETAPEAIEAGIEATDADIRRASIRFALAHGARLATETRRRAASDPDPALRLLAARSLSAGAPEAELRDALPALLADRSTAVRRQALDALGTRLAGVPEAVAALERALLDPSASVREAARFHQSRLGSIDASAIYRAALSSARGRTLEAAVAGVGETGGAADAEALLPFATHERPGVRRAAIRAVARLDAAHHEPSLLAALRDPSAGVCREAAAGLADRMHVVGEAPIAQLLAESPSPLTRLRAVDLLAGLDRWTALAALLDAACHADPAVAARARRRVERSSTEANRGYVRPSAAALARVDAALARASGGLDADVARALASTIASWRGG